MNQNPRKPRLRHWLVLLISTIAATVIAETGLAQDTAAVQEQKSTYDLRLEYARLNLQLAETELQWAQQFNKEVAESIPASLTDDERQIIVTMKQISETAMERLRSNVEIAEVQFSHATTPSTGSPEEIRKRYAAEKIDLAKFQYDFLAARKSRGEAVNDLELSRSELKYKLAQLELELLDNPENVLTLVDSLQRQIDRLAEEIMAQDQRIGAMEDQKIRDR